MAPDERPDRTLVRRETIVLAVAQDDLRIARRRRSCTAALATAVSTGVTSVGDWEMTRRISAVAVCCSSAFAQLGEQPHVLDGDHRLGGEGLNEQRSARSEKAPGPILRRR